MGEPMPRPEAVEAATAWLAEHGSTYTDEALREHLAAAGYTPAEVALARERLRAAEPATTPAQDLRARAARRLILGTLGIWTAVVVVLYLVAETRPHSYYNSGPVMAGLGGGVLAVALLVILVPSLIGVSRSSSLRAGAEGALAGILAVPFVFLVIVAGLCVATVAGQ